MTRRKLTGLSSACHLEATELSLTQLADRFSLLKRRSSSTNFW